MHVHFIFFIQAVWIQPLVQVHTITIDISLPDGCPGWFKNIPKLSDDDLEANVSKYAPMLPSQYCFASFQFFDVVDIHMHFLPSPSGILTNGVSQPEKEQGKRKSSISYLPAVYLQYYAVLAP